MARSRIAVSSLYDHPQHYDIAFQAYTRIIKAGFLWDEHALQQVSKSSKPQKTLDIRYRRNR
jgi:hypothetical protein